MKWISHITFAGAICATISPPLVPIAILGSTAPDWLERVYKVVTHGRRLRHRGPTHYVMGWVALSLFAALLFDFHHILLAFALGGLSHVFCDSMTVHGVPLSPLSDRKVHILGGRMTTGCNEEYMFILAVFVVCLAVSVFKTKYAGYAPFFYDWAGYYHDGLADAHEWKSNRFKFF